ncbi:MAG: ATP synthase F1 subunit delta [Clostridia bacterium]|nr:ATP synthase F1 subunit delta [Clostridia bacterium]
MSESSREYAEALFMLSRENNSSDEFENALDLMCELFDANPEYVELLSSPVISKKERSEILSNTFGDSLPEYVFSFIMMLCENGHIKDYKDCFNEYKTLNKDAKMVVTAKVTSAVELSMDEKAKLVKKLEKICKKTVVPEYVIDESIMGGVIVEADGKILDGSLKRRLSEVREVIEG